MRLPGSCLLDNNKLSENRKIKPATITIDVMDAIFTLSVQLLLISLYLYTTELFYLFVHFSSSTNLSVLNHSCKLIAHLSLLLAIFINSSNLSIDSHYPSQVHLFFLFHLVMQCGHMNIVQAFTNDICRCCFPFIQSSQSLKSHQT